MVLGDFGYFLEVSDCFGRFQLFSGGLWWFWEVSVVFGRFRVVWEVLVVFGRLWYKHILGLEPQSSW